MGPGFALVTGASANASADTMAMNTVFRFFMLFTFLFCFGLRRTLVIENSFPAVH